MTVHTAAPEVEVIAAKLIARHHTHLADVEIRYLFRDKAAVSKGHLILGKARLITGLTAFLAAGIDADGADPFFVIEIAHDTWAALKADQRIALVDHELCHCTIVVTDNEDARPAIRGHDVEAFRAEVERHGLWRTDLEDFAKSIAQQQLPLDGEQP